MAKEDRMGSRFWNFFRTTILCGILLQVQITFPIATSVPASPLRDASLEQVVILPDNSSITTPAAPSFKLGFNTAEAGEFKPQKIDTVDYISLITMIALGIVAAGLVKSCKIGANYEVYIYAAGALTYILGEIAVNASYKDIKDKTIQYNDNGKLTNEQEKALKDLKKSYEDIKDITQIKQMLQLAAAAAFLVATGIATIKWIKEKASLKACLAAIELDEAKLLPITTGSQQYAEPCDKAAADTCSLNLKKETTNELLIEALKAKDTEPSIAAAAQVKAITTKSEAESKSSCTSCIEFVNLSDKSCTQKHIEDIANSVACTPVTVAAKTNQPGNIYDSFLTKLGLKEKTPPRVNSQFFDQLFAVLLPKAYADSMGAMLGIGAAGLGILAGLIIPKSFWVDKLIPFPNRRAIVFAASAALAGATALLTNNIKKKAQSNIDKIDKILQQYANYDNASTTSGGSISSGMGVTRNGKDVYGAGVKIGNGQKFDCMASTNSGACANYNDLINNSIKEGGEINDGAIEGLSIDPAIMSATNALGEAVNGVQGNSKISGETLGKFAQVAASQGAARTYLDNVRKKLNDVLKANGEEPLDFAALDQQTVQEMKNNTAQELQKNGINLADEVQKGNLGPAYQQELKDAKNVEEKVTPLTASLSSSSKTNKRKTKSRVRDLVTGVNQGQALAPTSNAQEYEEGDATINEVNGPSLWEILMHRYRSFWPKFFNRATPVPTDKK